MFDGASPDQFHHFLASSRASLPIPFPFPLHPTTTTTSPPPPPPFPSFDPYPSHHHHLHHHLASSPKNELPNHEQTTLVSTSLVLERERSAASGPAPPWSNDEVLALLRIRSSMDNWFPDFSWEHVSRKLAELGFKRTAEKCKQRFEEESRNNLNNNSLSFNKNMRFLSELDELYQQKETPRMEDQNNNVISSVMSPSAHLTEEVPKKKSKRKRRRFEMFKGLCEAIVERIMAQQEELHKKIIEEMMKREEEKIAREEAWKSQEMERLNKEFEIREKEQQISSSRQAKIIEFLNRFSPQSTSQESETIFKKFEASCEMTTTTTSIKKSKKDASQQNPSSPNQVETKENQSEPNESQPSDMGKRWPREEVMALINLRCSLNNNDKDGGGAKGPLWERISQAMQELGYSRSAKRCKEKWENINKYFRKTKDNNKKRSLDSRTCPYFHQLNTLYNQGKLRGASPENRHAD